MTESGKRGILLVNLGSPDSTSVPDVRRYLNQFLMDPCVIDSPWPIRRFVVSCFILPKRPAESAEAYSSVWTPEGSPLIVTSEKMRKLLDGQMEEPVGLAMRYQNPSMEDVMCRMIREEGVSDLFLVPLYPHFAMSSFETTVIEAERVIRDNGLSTRMTVIRPFYEHPAYIDALVESARPYLEEPYDHLLFSYHGLPERHLRKSDPTGEHCLKCENCCEVDSPAHATCYRAQVFKTTKAFAEKAGLDPERYSVAFQSRLGRDPWLQPFTDKTIEELAAKGVKKLKVICPAFVADCLETIEEIGMQGAEDFQAAGGESLELVPCMNDHPAWIRALNTLCSPA